MQRLEVSGVVRLIYRSLGVKGLRNVSQGRRKIFFKQRIRFRNSKNTNSLFILCCLQQTTGMQ